MAMFHSYVKLPEGIPNLQVLFFSTVDFQGDTWLDSTMQVDLPHSQPEKKHVGDIVQCTSQTFFQLSQGAWMCTAPFHMDHMGVSENVV